MTVPYSSWVIQLLHYTALPSAAQWIFISSGTLPIGEIAAGILKGATVITLFQMGGDLSRAQAPDPEVAHRNLRTVYPWVAFRWKSRRGQMKTPNISSLNCLSYNPLIDTYFEHSFSLTIKIGKYVVWKLKIVSMYSKGIGSSRTEAEGHGGVWRLLKWGA